MPAEENYLPEGFQLPEVDEGDGNPNQSGITIEEMAGLEAFTAATTVAMEQNLYGPGEPKDPNAMALDVLGEVDRTLAA